MDTTFQPVQSTTSARGSSNLDPDSYTAHRLSHGSAEHLHITSRRFFIGPIPEGWLSSNRKSWYKRKLELSTYSSKPVSFSAAINQGQPRRITTDIESQVDRIGLATSFPQPQDIRDAQNVEPSREGSHGDTDRDGEFEVEEAESDYQSARSISELEPLSIVVQDEAPSPAQSPNSLVRKPKQDSPDPAVQPRLLQISGIRNELRDSQDTSEGDTTTRTSSWRQNGLEVAPDNIDVSSRTALLGSPSLGMRLPDSARTTQQAPLMDERHPIPVSSDPPDAPRLRRRMPSGVRFKVAEAVVDKQRRAARRVDSVANRVGRHVQRHTLDEGTIIRMEKMLVRIDVTRQRIPDDYDENASVKMETNPVDKWKEYMVVARRSRRTDEDDVRLQFYTSRVIPEIDDERTSKKPVREIKLVPKSTRVNLFSPLDKSVVVWHPYRKGCRIIVMKPESTAHSIEWYTFLRDTLGWRRPDTLEIFVPDLDVSLRIEKPFESRKMAGLGEVDDGVALQKIAEAEQAVASNIISECMTILQSNPEWANVMQKWRTSAKVGLAWRRYDRLEWIHGANEQKMFGSMAMQHSYELELRPKVHYPTRTAGRKGQDRDEPNPVEGFLIRLTSQKGLHRHLGKTYFKRLYFHSQDNLLFFNRPANSTPPHPPRLATISGGNIPSSTEILKKTPTMYEVDPYRLEDDRIAWLLHHHDKDRVDRHDREAYAERLRNCANLNAADGFVDMTSIRQVRRMQWGAHPVDETLESGSDSDVDFHEPVEDTRHEDGATSQIDDSRILELVLHNGLIVRLQAYNSRTRDEWIRRLRRLIKYWTLRKSADMSLLRNVRAENLSTMNIDEAMEAALGQFGEKWEVTRNSVASPSVWNLCPIAGCRTIALSGELYLKPRRRSTFHKCSAILAGGQLLIYQTHLRTASGRTIPHIHQERTQIIDLKDCYVYSGLVVEDDLLYQNRTYDPSRVGGLTQSTLPRIWREDNWTSSDLDGMCCFVLWVQRKTSWFRTAGNVTTKSNSDNDPRHQTRNLSISGISMTGASAASGAAAGGGGGGSKRAKIRKVRQLGIPGRGMVFKCRSRAERDLWVQNLAVELERVVDREKWDELQAGDLGVRLAK